MVQLDEPTGASPAGPSIGPDTTAARKALGATITCAMFTRTVILAVLLTAAISGVAAQGLTDRARVRISMKNDSPVSGEFGKIESDTLWYWPRMGVDLAATPLELVVRIHVREPAGRGYGAWRGVKFGFAAGFLVGAISCLAEGGSCQSRPGEGELEAALGGGLFLGVGIAPFGGVVGLLRPGSRWRKVALPSAAN